MSNSFPEKVILHVANKQREEVTTPVVAVQDTPAVFTTVGSTSAIASTGVGFLSILLLVLVTGFAYTRIYKVVKPNEAIVRSGGFGMFNGTRVFLEGGYVFIPAFHERVVVNMNEVKVGISRAGRSADSGAVRTRDYLRAKLNAQVYVVVAPELLRTAAQRLSRNGRVSAELIVEAVEARCDDAIRNASKSKTLAEIDSDKEGFGLEIKNALKEDLEGIGLVCQSVALTDIEEDGDAYQEENYFDVQGKREREEKVSISKKEIAQVNSDRDTAIADIERKRALSILEIDKERERAEAALQAETIRIKAENEQLGLSAQAEQQRILAENQAASEAGVEIARIQRETAVALQQRDKEEQIVGRDLKLRLASEAALQEQAVEEERTKLAKAKVATAESRIQTASEVEAAERDRQKALIDAATKADADKIKMRTAAEAELEAARSRAEAIQIVAEAEKNQQIALAEGRLKLVLAENQRAQFIVQAELIQQLGPELVQRLADIMAAMKPAIGETKLYSFGGSDKSAGDVSKTLAQASSLGMLEQVLSNEGLASAVMGLLGKLGKNADAPSADVASLPEGAGTESVGAEEQAVS